MSYVGFSNYISSLKPNFTISPQLVEKCKVVAQKVDAMIDANFREIVLGVAVLVLSWHASWLLLCGMAVGAVAHYKWQPNLVVRRNERMVSITSATCALVGAVARLMPATPMLIPFMGSMAVGSTAYRLVRGE